MAGAVGSHFLSVRQMTALAEAGVLRTPDPSRQLPAADAPAHDARSMIAELRRQNEAMARHLSGNAGPQSSTDAGPAIASEPDLNRVLSELVAINRDLRSQIAETNRDLMELRFQVDTHSEQFRPLNTVEEPIEELDAYDTSIGVLPPLDAP
jgi:uncharacterized membrane protein YccC